MIEIDCRECVNCDLMNNRCRVYGSDPEQATKKCAGDGFNNYIRFGDQKIKKALIHGKETWRNVFIDYDKKIQAPDIAPWELERIFKYVCALESRVIQSEKERDRAVNDLYCSTPCSACERKCDSLLDENYMKYCVHCCFGSEFVYCLSNPEVKEG